VTVVSKPRSSTVAPTTIPPSARGTRYTDEPPTTPRTERSSSGDRGSPLRRRICPFTGRTGGTTPSGSPVIDPDQQPAASTTTGARRKVPSQWTPRTAPPATSTAVTAARCHCTPRAVAAAHNAVTNRRVWT